MLRFASLFLVLAASASSAAADDESIAYITSALSSGPGSIRAAIETANSSPKATRIESRLEPGAVVYVFRELPPIKGYGTELDAAGMTLKGGTCRRADGRSGCSGLIIAGPMALS